MSEISYRYNCTNSVVANKDQTSFTGISNYRVIEEDLEGSNH